jgi:hypothetical protein
MAVVLLAASGACVTRKLPCRRCGLRRAGSALLGQAGGLDPRSASRGLICVTCGAGPNEQTGEDEATS